MDDVLSEKYQKKLLWIQKNSKDKDDVFTIETIVQGNTTNHLNLERLKKIADKYPDSIIELSPGNES